MIPSLVAEIWAVEQSRSCRALRVVYARAPGKALLHYF
jgi:hypothetical protein